VFLVWYDSLSTYLTYSLCILTSWELTSTTIQIPQTLTDRYARIHHGFTDHCHKYAIKPPACRAGSDDAQSAAAWSHVGLSTLLLLVNPVVGSISDIHGRKPFILLALALSCVPAFVFYVIVRKPEMNPVWYYVSLDALVIPPCDSSCFSSETLFS
jgi:MFS family permease